MTIERALVVDKVDNYHYKVRILSLNKSEGAVGSTPNSELYVACVNTSPGICPAYTADSVVYVGFENGDCSSPVILGALYNTKTVNIQSDINTTSLIVNTNAKLPADTVIGSVTAENICTLQGQTVRIKTKFDEIDIFKADTDVRFTDITDTIIYMQEHDQKADADAVKLAKRVTEAEKDIDENTDNIATNKILIDGNTANINVHTSNSDIHVTSALKSYWNQAVTDLSTHAGDTVIHVSASEKSTWNSKAAGDHNHNTVYALLNHTHDYAPSSHNHTSLSSVSTITFTTNSYGTTLPQNPIEGQIYFLLEE